ncbi:MAG: thioredoxin domain-containing protein [Candidatus Heimdallarchaeaceae archaeon]
MDTKEKEFHSPNNLIKEKSPYLLQHAYNPVNWFAWGDEAFEKAKKENKLVFLSIGYSTCHWCHVMEEESFEDEEVAVVLNKNFVAIKVDREERPDIDSIYMNVCQMLTGRGGWPLTIILTPEKIPFYAGTYFPKKGRFGMIGLLDILNQLKELWKNEKERVLSSVEKILKHLKSSSVVKKESFEPLQLFEQAFEVLQNQFDRIHGGFGPAPKFPTTHRLLFLLHYWQRTGNQFSLEMVEITLTKMSLGGIYDHVGGGFHRYSTDRTWLVPHFEKMLYDQAMLTIINLKTFQATKKKKYKEVAKSILTYVMRDLVSPEGGFYSAEDADSEGEEGKYYVWEKKEIEDILGEESELFCELFNIREEGNFYDERTKEKTKKNILHLSKPFYETGEENEELHAKQRFIKDSVKQLLFHRQNRVSPLKDDKILTDWNGLMIVAFSLAARVLKEEKYLKVAKNAIEFILRKMFDKEKNLLHRYREGESAIPANLDDYSFLIWGLIELYETTFTSSYLMKAYELTEQMIKHFWDEENHGFFFTPDTRTDLIVREKLVYDGAIPSGNSVAMLNILKLSRITSNSSYEEKANQLMSYFASQIKQAPVAFTFLLTALDYAVGPSYEIVIVRKKEEERTLQEVLMMLTEHFLPNKIVLIKLIDDKELEKLIPIIKEYTLINNQLTIYVCKNFVCKQPTNNPYIMVEELLKDEN